MKHIHPLNRLKVNDVMIFCRSMVRVNKIDEALRKRKLTKQTHLQTDGQTNVNADSQTDIKTETTEFVPNLLGLSKVS